jgi:hypothetical protein
MDSTRMTRYKEKESLKRMDNYSKYNMKQVNDV